MKQLLKDLAKVIAKRKDLEFEESAMKLLLKEKMIEKGGKPEETDGGVFSLAHRSYYSYSDKVARLEEKVALAKVDEVEKGVAKESVTSYILYKEE